MSDLTKRESAYFMGFAIVGLTVLIGSLVFWTQLQNNCWSKYDTEAEAIAACEVPVDER
jgi:hypothetical protein